MNKLSPTEAAWLAGLVDGDGCLTISRGRTQRGQGQPKFDISSRDVWLLEYIAALIGVGRPTSGGYNRGRKYWHYQLCGGHLKELLPQILPYLVYKRPQAEVLLLWSTTHRTRRECRVVLSPEELELRKVCREKIYALNATPEVDHARTPAA